MFTFYNVPMFIIIITKQMVKAFFVVQSHILHMNSAARFSKITSILKNSQRLKVIHLTKYIE